MNKDLYYSITKFECLSEVEAQKIRETMNFVVSKRDVLRTAKLECLTFNFAYDDVLDYLANEERQKEQPELGIE